MILWVIPEIRKYSGWLKRKLDLFYFPSHIHSSDILPFSNFIPTSFSRLILSSRPSAYPPSHLSWATTRQQGYFSGSWFVAIYRAIALGCVPNLSAIVLYDTTFPWGIVVRNSRTCCLIVFIDYFMINGCGYFLCIFLSVKFSFLFQIFHLLDIIACSNFESFFYHANSCHLSTRTRIYP